MVMMEKMKVRAKKTKAMIEFALAIVNEGGTSEEGMKSIWVRRRGVYERKKDEEREREREFYIHVVFI